MSKMGPKRMVEIAHHQAAHAVVAFHLRRKIHDVWISSTEVDDSHGNCRHVNPLYGKTNGADNNARANWVAEEILIALSGPEAERRCNPRRKMARSDREKIEAFFNAADPPFPQREKERILQLAKRETAILVRKHWPSIERVAAALLQRGQLNGDEVERLVSST